jgi:ankyrin repeat protein
MINADFNKEIDRIHTLTTKIFQLIKMQDWKNLFTLIKTNDMDYNIKDNSNTWLIEYLVMFNQLNIIELLLTKNIRIDIKDEQNRSILYSVIKFSYIPILRLLLKKDKEIIGKSILEIRDNEENIPLFYAIKFFNKEIIEIIFNYQNNFYSKNSDGENALHLAVKTLDLDIFKLILTKITDINIKKNNGETCLHLAIKHRCYDIIKYIIAEYIDNSKKNINLNLTESKYNFSPLHYIFLSLDFQLVMIFEKCLNRFNPNIQDKSGNIFLHYFINNIIQNSDSYKKDNLYFLVDLTKKLNINYNLYNIDGNTPCHILLLNLDIFKKDYNIIINNLIEDTDLNVQNQNGESCLFLLIKNHFWKEVSNILIKKKLDIFIIDINRNTMFDYLDSDDLEEFTILVTNSYLYLLTDTEYGSKWLDYWDNRCKKNINLKELNETEKELIQNINIDSNKSLCFALINDKIKNYIKSFKKDKKMYNIHSFPIHTKYPKLIDNYPDVVLPTFTGSTIDVLSGLMFLNNKYKTQLATSLKLIDSEKSLINCASGVCEISGFEILWKNFQLLFPSSKSNDLMRELTHIKINKKIRFFSTPIGIELNTKDYVYGHANILLFDFVTMQVERFEPHGAEPPYGLDYNARLLDNLLENKIDSFKLGFKYISPFDYLPKIGFQIKEIYELKSDYIGDPNGFCAVWCIWWTDMRIGNSDIERNKLVDLLFKEIINEEYSYKKLIRNYSYFITDLRDKLLTKANININNWINDTMSLEQKNTLEKAYTDEIKKITD